MRLTIFSAKRGEIIWAWCRIFEVNFRGSGQHLGTQAYTVRHQAVGVCILTLYYRIFTLPFFTPRI